MNTKDKENLKLIEYRLDEQDERVKTLHTEFDTKSSHTHTAIKFIKENLFNPESGLWAETKQNSQFRENTSKWRMVMGAGVIAAIGDMIWDWFST